MEAKTTLITTAGLGLAVLLGLVVAIPLLLTSDSTCAGGPGNATSGGSAFSDSAAVQGVPGHRVGRWEPDQLRNAAAIITAGKTLGVPARAQSIAVMTAMGESGLRVVDHGDAAGPDSRGLFQQRGNGAWGTYADRMNPSVSATSFYQALTRVPGWAGLSPTVAAHRTQHNADPNYYTRFWSDAVNLTSALTGHADTTQSYSTRGTPADCGAVFLAGGGAVVYPLPAGSGYTDQTNWRGAGAHWGAWHTGTDLSVACGTPVLAANAGKVIISTDQAWAGRWLVKISTGAHTLTTWYAHMRAVDVADGDYVTAGQQIGEVGDLGNAVGCHLHFEVHQHNGPIYGPDNTNPTTWLATHVGTTVPMTPAAAHPGSASSGSSADGGFRLATWNILGASHTGPGADQHPTWASGAARVPGMISVLNRWGTDVAALQEVQPSQRHAIEGASGGGYAMFPPPGTGGDNRVVWRTSTFAQVDGGTFTIPYFNGHKTPMPAVLLRQRSTGKAAWFLAVHNPAETGTYHHQGGYRVAAVAKERGVVRSLVGSGHPVFLLGDLNATGAAFCPLTAGNLLRSASGGTGSPVCHQPAHPQIDWVFAAGHAGFTGYRVDHTPEQTRVSDHPIVITQAHLG